MQKINRKSHVGKNSGEKAAYRKFLSERFALDKTEGEQENLIKTNSSNFDNEELEYMKPRGKSLKLKVEDFFRSNWTITIVGGVVVLVIGWVLSFAFRQGVQTEKISAMEDKIGSVEKDVSDVNTLVNSLRTDLNGMRIEFSKDIEYLLRSKE